MNKISIWGLIKKHWPKTIILVVLILLSSFLSTYPINLLRKVIDTAGEFIGAQDVVKEEVIRKLGNVSDTTQRNNVNKVCFNTFFFGEEINWKEVFA